MSFSINYKPLFRLHLLHNFFLGIGEEVYDHTEIPDVFNNYNFQDFAKITPTENTLKVLRNHKILTKITDTGIMCFIAVDEDARPIITVDDEELQFMLYIQDSLFERYTKINTTEKPIYNFQSDMDSGSKKLDFLNIKSASPISDFAINYDSDETSDYQQLLKTVGVKERVSLFGMITISINDLMTGKGEVYNEEKEYKIVFDSKTSVWVYLDSQDNEQFRTEKEFPFVKKGTIKIMDEDATIYRMATPNDIEESGETKIYV